MPKSFWVILFIGLFFVVISLVIGERKCIRSHDGLVRKGGFMMPMGINNSFMFVPPYTTVGTICDEYAK